MLSVQAVGILEYLTQCLHALTSVWTNLNKAVLLRRQVLRHFPLNSDKQKLPSAHLRGGHSGRQVLTDGNEPQIWSGFIQRPPEL